jgi:perosamine synthetase
LLALGVKAGDEVILPDITWIASVEPVMYIGAHPVFVDVLPDTWCLDPKKFEEAITPKSRVVMPVHLYGNMTEMDEIMTIAKRHNIRVLEDSAEALGSEYKGRKAGSIGDASVFSFHGTKTISTGEGGMIATNDDALNARVRVLNDHGRDPKVGKTFWMAEYGYKYKMSNLQAAMGCAQIERADELISKKREVFGWYKALFSDKSRFTLNPDQPHVKNSVWMPTVVFDKSLGVDRDALMRHMKANGVDSRPFFYPLSLLPMFEPKPENRVSYDLYHRAINLPSHHGLERGDAERVFEVVNSFIST